MIRVLVVEDSLTMQAVLAEVLASDPGIEVVGVAANGAEGVHLAQMLRPDVITMDIRMPVMDGFEATRLIMQECPTRIVVVSASVDSPELNISFNAIKVGALDVVEKPAGGGANFDAISERLISAVKLMSEIQVVKRRPAAGGASGINAVPQTSGGSGTRFPSIAQPASPTARSGTRIPAVPPVSLAGSGSRLPSATSANPTRSGSSFPSVPPSIPTPVPPSGSGLFPGVRASDSGLSRAVSASSSGTRAVSNVPAILAVGSSTGGPAALSVFLKGLPATMPVPVVIVQHITSGFGKGLVEWLQSECALPLRLGAADQRIYPGEVYFAPDDYHMILQRRGILGLTRTPPVSFVRPSATVLFQSVAAHYGSQAVGVILTGMGNDGAVGLKDIRNAGGTTFAQDQATCVVYGMPKAAVELNAVDHVFPLPAIAPQVARVCRAT